MGLGMQYENTKLFELMSSFMTKDVKNFFFYDDVDVRLASVVDSPLVERELLFHVFTEFF